MVRRFLRPLDKSTPVDPLTGDATNAWEQYCVAGSEQKSNIVGYVCLSYYITPTYVELNAGMRCVIYPTKQEAIEKVREQLVDMNRRLLEDKHYFLHADITSYIRDIEQYGSALITFDLSRRLTECAEDIDKNRPSPISIRIITVEKP
jgi:hypothetical protein